MGSSCSKQTTEVKVAVSAEDGEVGLFVPAPRQDHVLIAAAMTVARTGSIKVPILNALEDSVALPTKAVLGTWIPQDANMKVFELGVQLTESELEKWLEHLHEAKRAPRDS